MQTQVRFTAPSLSHLLDKRLLLKQGGNMARFFTAMSLKWGFNVPSFALHCLLIFILLYVGPIS